MLCLFIPSGFTGNSIKFKILNGTSVYFDIFGFYVILCPNINPKTVQIFVKTIPKHYHNNKKLEIVLYAI